MDDIDWNTVIQEMRKEFGANYSDLVQALAIERARVASLLVKLDAGTVRDTTE